MKPCKEWQGYCKPDGYGQVGKRGPTRLAHRIAWIEANGPIPDGLDVLHHCDNPPCIEVEHLFLGTKADNSADMMAKGRHYAVNGENSGNAKLTDAQVIEIRERRAQRESVAALSERFGVSAAQISRVARSVQRAKPTQRKTRSH